MNLADLTPGKGIRIDTDGTMTTIDVTLGGLQQAVGGYVERVAISDGRVMWVNEEGLLVGLDWNPVAQILFDRRYGPERALIVGNVVVTLEGE